MSKCENIVEPNEGLVDIFILMSVVSVGYFGSTFVLVFFFLNVSLGSLGYRIFQFLPIS